MSNSYNTWGGKNNSWGNKNRKQKNNDPRYEESKAFKIFVIAALGITLAVGGINTVQDLLDKYDTAKEAVELVEDIQNKISNKEETSVNNNNSKAKVENESGIEIDMDDIKDLLDKIDEYTEENNIQLKVENIIVVDYNNANTLELYRENIINKLSKYDNTITFAIVINEYLTNDTANEKLEVIQQLINDTQSESNSDQIEIRGISNIPNANNLTIGVTYIR